MEKSHTGPETIITIEPARYYSAPDVARMLGVCVTTVYQSLAGAKRVPLPRATKLGRSVRFFGQHILDFNRELGCVLPGQLSVDGAPTASATAEKRRGRPRKLPTDRGTA